MNQLDQGPYSKVVHCVGQGSPISGPRSEFGPRDDFIGPTKFSEQFFFFFFNSTFTDNIQAFIAYRLVGL